LLQRGINGRVVRRQMGEIDFLSIIIANDLNRLFNYGHHAKSEQIDFDNSEIGAIFFVPLHHNATWHGRRFQRHNGIKLPLANHHATGMLPKVTRQILHGLIKLKELLDSAGRISPIPASLNCRSVVSFGSFHSHVCTSPDKRPSVSSSKPEYFANFTRR
jgi:hypothetical protein